MYNHIYENTDIEIDSTDHLLNLRQDLKHSTHFFTIINF